MTSEQPKYQTLINWIEQQILEEKFKSGDKFYSENQLSKMFSISRQTVRQAVGILVEQNVLERRHGSGTYVIYGDNSSRTRTKNIGLISTYLDSYIFPSIIKGVDTVLSKEGYSLQLTLTHNRVEDEKRGLLTMLEKNVDGIIIEPSKSGLPNPNTQLYLDIKQRQIPLIFFNAYYPDLDFPHVAMDDKKAGQIATQCLIDAGHKRIAGIFQADDLQGHLRYAGYVSALSHSGISVNSQNVAWYVTEDIPYLADSSGRIGNVVSNCTGLVCYNDQIAHILYGRFTRENIRVPEDISIVGIDNSEFAVICEVPLTSVAHPRDQLGRVVGKNILKLIKNPNFDATFEFVPELVERSSVKILTD